MLDRYLEHLEIEKGNSPKTCEKYRQVLKVFITRAKIQKPEDITKEKVFDFRKWLAREPLSKKTQRFYVLIIRGFIQYLNENGFTGLIASTIKLPKEEERKLEVLEHKELKRLLAAPKGRELRALRDKAILETLFSTGLRLSELCALDRAIDWEKGEVLIRGKGGKMRLVFFSVAAVKAIKEYLVKREDIDEALFVSLSKKNKSLGRIKPISVQRLVDENAKLAGIVKKVHPHQLRHAYAGSLLDGGTDLPTLQDLLGHAKIETTKVYLQRSNQKLKEAHDRVFNSR